jgi:hypothetical protein
MPSPPRERPRPTIPEEEGIEFYPDAWERFERTVDKVIRLLRFIEPERQLPGIGRSGRDAVAPIRRAARSLRLRVADEFI